MKKHILAGFLCCVALCQTLSVRAAEIKMDDAKKKKQVVTVTNVVVDHPYTVQGYSINLQGKIVSKFLRLYSTSLIITDGAGNIYEVEKVPTRFGVLKYSTNPDLPPNTYYVNLKFTRNKKVVAYLEKIATFTVVQRLEEDCYARYVDSNGDETIQSVQPNSLYEIDASGFFTDGQILAGASGKLVMNNGSEPWVLPQWGQPLEPGHYRILVYTVPFMDQIRFKISDENYSNNQGALHLNICRIGEMPQF
jgi:hypothetical protein